jgi:phosphonate dehydrogenase
MISKPKVVITHWVHPEVIDFLAPHCELILNQTKESLPASELILRARNAQAMMVFMPDSIDADFLSVCRELKIVAGALKGYDNFDVNACSRYGVWFTIVPDLLTVPTAELTIGLLIAISRHMLAGDHFVRSSRFKGWRPTFYGNGICGRTVGIIGMGAIGRALAQRLTGFEANVLYYDKVRLSRVEEIKLKATAAHLHELLVQSDFVIVLLPLTDETKHFINSEAIALMKSGSYIINPARGFVVDEQAIIAALESGQLAGYAADVYAMEDWLQPDKPQTIPQALLSNIEKTFFTPHLGSAVDDLRRKITLEAARNILQALNGETPDGAVNSLKASDDPVPSKLFSTL